MGQEIPEWCSPEPPPTSVERPRAWNPRNVHRLYAARRYRSALQPARENAAKSAPYLVQRRSTTLETERKGGATSRIFNFPVEFFSFFFLPKKHSDRRESKVLWYVETWRNTCFKMLNYIPKKRGGGRDSSDCEELRKQATIDLLEFRDTEGTGDEWSWWL